MTCHPTRRRTVLCVEPLEAREVPATLVSGSRLTYQDVDGDTVSVTFSKPILTAANVNTIFRFDTAGVDGSNAAGQQLQAIDLSGLGAIAAGVGITTSATRSPLAGGDGFAHVGEIIAASTDVGLVTIDGDLGRILAGDGRSGGSALQGLTALSLGRHGLGTGAADLHSVILGNLGFLRLKSDLQDAFVDVWGGDIGPVTIRGSLLGGAADFSGSIKASGNIGAVTIKGDVVGGGGFYSGTIDAEGALAGVTIGGSLRGGSETGGLIYSAGRMGPVNIIGNIIGGTGPGFSGAVFASRDLARVTVGGSVHGGDGHLSGLIRSDGAMGSVKIGGDLVGAGGMNSGAIFGNASIASVSIGGSLRGGDGADSGQIVANQRIGPVTVAGDVTGRGVRTGLISAGGALGAVSIGGSLQGGSVALSGRVASGGAMGPVRIARDVVGGSAAESGSVSAGGTLAGVTIGGSLRGGAGSSTGSISAQGAIGPVRITGDVVGGSAAGGDLFRSGEIHGRRIASLTIGGSLIAGTSNGVGTFAENGAIRVQDDLGPVLIRGNILGNPTNSFLLTARGSATPTATSDVAIRSLTVLGRVEFARIIAGIDTDDFAVNADAQIGPIVVGGDWIASSVAAGASPGGDDLFGSGDDVAFSGADVKDVAGVSSRIASVSISGEAFGTIDGADHFGIVAGTVGAVTVGGTPIALNAGAGNDDVSVGITGDFRVNEV